MRKIERAALRCRGWTWTDLKAAFEPAMASIGLVAGGSDVSTALLDQGEDGRLALFDDGALARRAALALATQTRQPVDVYEVIGTAGEKRFRFRVAAWRATPEGDLRSAEGQDVDLEDPEAFSGDLEEQADQVLEQFAAFTGRVSQSERRDFKKRKPAKASTPRVSALLTALQKSKRHEALPQADGRVELRIELAQGGTQRSFCSQAELEELQQLLGR